MVAGKLNVQYVKGQLNAQLVMAPDNILVEVVKGMVIVPYAKVAVK